MTGHYPPPALTQARPGHLTAGAARAAGWRSAAGDPEPGAVTGYQLHVAHLAQTSRTAGVADA